MAENTPGFSPIFSHLPFVKVWIHLVWSTKNRHPYLNDDVRPLVLQHIRDNAKAKGIFIEIINGYIDHIHCLLSFGTDQTVEDVVRLLKGESSFWINKQKLTKTKFGWQDEYFAVSVSESNVERVCRYILGQDEHHRKQTFDQEFREFLSQAGFQQFG